MNTKFLTLAAVAAFAIPGAAMAQDSTAETSVTPYVGVQAGYHDFQVDDDIIGVEKDSGFIGGAYAGLDINTNSPVVLGVEGNFNLGTSAIDYEYGVAGRVGFRTQSGSLLYVRGGYQWVDLDLSKVTGLPVDDSAFDDQDGDYLVGVGGEFGGVGGGKVRLGVDTLGFDTVRPTVGLTWGF